MVNTRRWLPVLIVIVSLLALVMGSHSMIAAQSSEADLLIWVDGPVFAGIEDAVSRFEADTGTGVTVEIMERPEMLENWSGEPNAPHDPDIFLMSASWLEQNGILLAPVELGSKSGEFVDFTISFFTRDGQIYGVPYMIENVALARNTDYVPEAPPTWGEVIDICQTLRESGTLDHPFALQEYENYHTVALVSAFGGYVFGTNPDGSFNPADIGLDSPGTIAALDLLAGMSRAELFTIGLDWEGVHETFENGDAAFLITGVWANARLKDSGVSYAVSRLPNGTTAASPFVHVTAFVISGNSRRIDVAQEFLINYIASESTMQSINQHNDIALPTHYLVLDQLEDPTLLGFAQAAAHGQEYPPESMIAPVWDIWRETTQSVREGTQSPEEAAHAAADRLRAELGQ